MKDYIEQRVLSISKYIIESGSTVRKAADVFKVSKSTVHKDVTQTLRKINPALYADVKRVLDKNKQERHLRGGEATRQKYRHKKPS